MDNAISLWQIGISGLVAGILIGALAYRRFAPSKKEAEKMQAELKSAHDELNSYKTSVNTHFDKTSELVNDLTQNYVKVYQHLAEGAQTLGDSKTLTNLLEQQQGRVLISVDDEAGPDVAAPEDRIVDTTGTAETPVEVVKETTESPVTASKDAIRQGDTDVKVATAEVMKPHEKPGNGVDKSEPELDGEKIEVAADKTESSESEMLDTVVIKPEKEDVEMVDTVILKPEKEGVEMVDTVILKPEKEDVEMVDTVILKPEDRPETKPTKH